MSSVKTLVMIILTATLVVRPLAPPAAANHGVFHKHQHNADSGSCCVEVWAHSSCSTNCNRIEAYILKSGTWYGNVCANDNDGCSSVTSPHRAYSYPSTVRTRHSYDSGFFSHYEYNLIVEVRYA